MWLINMRIGLGKNTAVINGQIALTDDLLGSKISWQAEIPSLAAVGRYLPTGNLPNISASIDAELDISVSGLGIKLSDSRLGEMTVDLDGRIPDPLVMDNLSATVQLAVPGLRSIPF